MSGDDRERESLEAKSDAVERDAEQAEDDEDAPSPFDHPAFLPVLLWGLALWFGYDGWFNESIEAVDFNRYGFGVLVVAAVYYTFKAVREARAAEAKGSDS